MNETYFVAFLDLDDCIFSMIRDKLKKNKNTVLFNVYTK